MEIYTKINGKYVVKMRTVEYIIEGKHIYNEFEGLIKGRLTIDDTGFFEEEITDNAFENPVVVLGRLRRYAGNNELKFFKYKPHSDTIDEIYTLRSPHGKDPKNMSGVYQGEWQRLKKGIEPYASTMKVSLLRAYLPKRDEKYFVKMRVKKVE